MPPSHRLRFIAALAATACALLGAAVPAGAAETATIAQDDPGFVPGELVVRERDPVSGDVHAHVRAIGRGRSVLRAARAAAREPGVVSATPNYIARASYVPNDPGRTTVPGGWQGLQWNLMPGAGIDAPGAWDHLIAVGRPGAGGVTVAVLDTGVAYRDRKRYRRSPDLARRTFTRGYDFVDGDRYPLDENGHGTHVASTIAETADNGIGLTGIAYGARIMPVRVLDRLGEGDSVAIASGIRYAARHGADVVNLSFEFGTTVRAGQIPDILDALRFAHRRGVLVIGAAGNGGARAIAYPARSGEVLSVGATTEHGCQADYSNTGRGLDLVAPGGGLDADIPEEGDRCRPWDVPGRDIFQMTFTGRGVRRFGIPGGYIGTSMAAPHVSAVAAMIIASGVLGPHPTPDAIVGRLRATAVDLGPPGHDARYGSGLVNAAAATAPIVPTPAPVAPPGTAAG